MATGTHRVEIQIDDRCFAALQQEAARLGTDVENVVQRAMSAWLNDMCEGQVTTAAEARAE